MDLEETCKAVVIKELLEKELVDLEKQKEKIMTKRKLVENKLLKYTWIAIFSISIFLMAMNLITRTKWTTLFYYPILLGLSVVIMFPFVLAICLYNNLVLQYNKHKNSKEYLVYQLDKEAAEANLQTICNMLNKASVVPKQYHNRIILAKFLEYIHSGRAINLEEAIRLFHSNKPSFSY